MSPTRNFLRRLKSLALLSSVLVSAAHAQVVYGWGSNYHGQLSFPPIQTGATAVSGGDFETLILKNGGVSHFGVLELTIPQPDELLSGVSAIASGLESSLALKDGRVFAWGNNYSGQCNVPDEAKSGVTAISSGSYFSLALKDGKVIAWGANDSGQLNLPPETQSGVTAISAGELFGIAIKDGGVIAWGNPNLIQLPAEAQSGVVAISAGAYHSLALKSDGSVIGWGANFYGELNIPDAARTDVVAIDAGLYFSMVLKADGTILSWGNRIADNNYLTPPPFAGPIVGIGGKYFHMLAIQAAAWATVNQTQVYGGGAVTGAVNLSEPAGPGGTKVFLSCDNARVHVPAFAIVLNGRTKVTFPITTDALIAPEVTVRITTSYNGTATVPAKFKLKGIPLSLKFNLTSVVGGSTTPVTATITSGSPVTADTTFSLSSSNDALLSAPSTVTIPNGQSTATVTLTHNAVADKLQESVAINANFLGDKITTGSFLINAFRATITFAPASVTSGQFTNAIVTLNAPAREALTVYTSGSDDKATMPSSATVAAGAQKVSFPISFAYSPTSYIYPVGVRINGNPFTTNLSVHSTISIAAVSLSSTMFGNSKVLGTIKLSRAAEAGGTVINLVASNGLSVISSVTVPEGLSTATFDVVADDVTSQISGQVTASSPVNQVVKTVTVNPLTPISFNMSSATVTPGSTFTGTVTLTVAPVTDTVVYIASADPLITVPASVTVYAGTTTATFNITAGFTLKAKNVTVTASKNGKAIAKSIKILAAS